MSQKKKTITKEQLEAMLAAEEAVIASKQKWCWDVQQTIINFDSENPPPPPPPPPK
jgi:hypothetical protein